MAKGGKRVIIKLQSTESAYGYWTTKNKQAHPERQQWKKYDPVVRRHVLFRESK